MGAPSTITGRLLYYDEAYDILYDVEENQEEEWDKIKNVSYILENEQQKYWIDAARDGNSVFGINGNYSKIDENEYISYADDFYYGVRPVIEISTSELQ